MTEENGINSVVTEVGGNTAATVSAAPNVPKRRRGRPAKTGEPSAAPTVKDGATATSKREIKATRPYRIKRVGPLAIPDAINEDAAKRGLELRFNTFNNMPTRVQDGWVPYDIPDKFDHLKPATWSKEQGVQKNKNWVINNQILCALPKAEAERRRQEHAQMADESEDSIRATAKRDGLYEDEWKQERREERTLPEE